MHMLVRPGALSPLLERTSPLPSLRPAFKVGICQLPWASIYISDINLSRLSVDSFIFPSCTTSWHNVFHSLLPVPFICSKCSLPHLPLQPVFRLNEFLFTFSWLLSSLLPIVSFSRLESPNLHDLSSLHSPWCFLVPSSLSVRTSL